MGETRHHDALPLGHRLDNYRIESVMGQGGFGITYCAQDLNVGRRIALKEYFPAASAMRVQRLRVAPRSAKLQDGFDYGLRRFRNEAQILAHFDHFNIVKVWRLLDLNGTAYIVMSFEEGDTLAAVLQRFSSGLPEHGIISLFQRVVGGLELVHGSGHVHRDLAPDNIIVRRNEEPVIVDFGAARCSYGQWTRSLEAIIKSGYSPPEQYMLDPTRQGPWTDIYALGAIAYRCIGGPTPPSSLDRQNAAANKQSDPLAPASSFGRGRYSQALLAAIDTALKLSPGHRPTSAGAWFAMFPQTPRQNVTTPFDPPSPKEHQPGFLRKLFGLNRSTASSPASRIWVLSGTNSSSAPVRLEISEDELRRSGGRLVVGRDEVTSHITIADNTVSRQHAVVWLDDHGLCIEDKNSSNGTWIDGRHIVPSTGAIPIGNRSHVKLGGVELVLSLT